MQKEIEDYINGLLPFQKELVQEMRTAVLAAGVEVAESIKWGSIAFHHKQNICGYRVAKAHVTLLFMEGATLADPSGILSGSGARARTYKVPKGGTVNGAAITELVQQCLAKGM